MSKKKSSIALYDKETDEDILTVVSNIKDGYEERLLKPLTKMILEDKNLGYRIRKEK